MADVALKRPVLLYFYGFPGAGKSYVAKNLSQHIKTALVSDDLIRSELFETPSYSEQENQIVRYIMDYLAEQFISSGMSVIYDTNATHSGRRRQLRNLAQKNKADHLMVWVQIDPESAFIRTQSRDHRLSENKHAAEHTRQTFNNQLAQMQNPGDEPYLVISGKHSFVTQKGAILNRLYQMGLIDSAAVQSNVAAPGLINLVPSLSSGRVDFSRRNINIK